MTQQDVRYEIIERKMRSRRKLEMIRDLTEELREELKKWGVDCGGMDSPVVLPLVLDSGTVCQLSYVVITCRTVSSMY